MFVNTINPVLLTVGPLEIRWYGLFYVVGFLFTIWWLKKFSKLKKEQVYDLMFWIIIAMIVGARVFEVFFWEPAYYFSNPIEILAVWHGGLSFHGGLAGIAVALFIFCKKNKISFYYLADLIVLPACLAMALGRIGNFINGELYGTVTNVSWCVKFQSAYGCRHPSQIYESLYNVANFCILFAITQYKDANKKVREGFVFWAFVFFYGVFRFATEFFRQSEVYYYGFSLGQILCGIMILAGGIMMIRFRKK